MAGTAAQIPLELDFDFRGLAAGEAEASCSRPAVPWQGAASNALSTISRCCSLEISESISPEMTEKPSGSTPPASGTRGAGDNLKSFHAELTRRLLQLKSDRKTSK